MTTRFSNQRAAIEQAFGAGWGARSPIDWPNAGIFVPPDGTPWVRLAIISGSANTMTIGTPSLDRSMGQVVLQCFTGTNVGTGPALALADAGADIFGKKNIALSDGVLRFRAASINEIGSDGQWWQVNMICPFQRDLIV